MVEVCRGIGLPAAEFSSGEKYGQKCEAAAKKVKNGRRKKGCGGRGSTPGRDEEERPLKRVGGDYSC